MGLKHSKKEEIKYVISTALREKFKKWTPGKTVMPFHTRLLAKDRMALFSFIQSINTTFGSVVYEPIAAEIAKDNFSEVVMGKKLIGIIQLT